MSEPGGATWGQPPEALTQEEKTWALVAHIGTLVAAYIALGFLAPLLVMLVKGDASPFVRRHAVESLNFQISLLIYSIVGAIVAFVLAVATFGIGLVVLVPLVIVLAIAVLVLIIMATVKAGNGEDYRYPLTIRFIS
ncbi:DUF4870 domain-containing protein [Nocardioides sp. GXQ0305]|uniref:DUF4870 domain-containing protein n=1 Tax=Nocardioides sp. GXQ0305 TaxID=3423912 RepID=UPI003D7DFA99